MAEPTALVPVGDWQVLRGTGNDRLSFLHRLVTGKVEGLTPGQGARALLLTVKGHIVADLRVAVLPDEVRLVVAPGQGEAAGAALARYAIMDDFTVRLEAAWGVRAVHGPEAAERLAGVGVVVPAELQGGPRLQHAVVPVPELPGAPEGLWLLREQAGGQPGFWIFGPPPALEALTERLRAAGLPQLDPAQAELRRIEAGEPRFGSEITEDYFPMELGLSGAIDYSKGCYLGQEPIVRIRDRGHLNWRLVTLRGLEPGTLRAGDRLEAEGKPKAGRITSAAVGPGGRAVALAMLHVSVPVGARVRVRPAEPAPEAASAPPASPAESASVSLAAPGLAADVTGEPRDA